MKFKNLRNYKLLGVVLSCFVVLSVSGLTLNTQNHRVLVNVLSAFRTVTIGGQVWTKLNYSGVTFRNGDQIQQAQTAEQWSLAANNKTPAWCYPEKTGENDSVYGKLYNWYAIADPRGFAPEGYHVPAYSEMQKLVQNSGGKDNAGTTLKSSTGWNAGVKNSNKTGFSAMPAGMRTPSGSYMSFGSNGAWWTLSEFDMYAVWSLQMFHNVTGCSLSSYSTKGQGLSVRLIRD